MPINAGYEYAEAQKKFLSARTIEEKIEGTEEMLRTAPKHKGAENLIAQLRLRLSKLKKEAEKEKAKKKGRSIGIRKEGDAQVTILGFTKSGKSQLLAALTDAKPKISEIPFTTLAPEIGALNLDGIIIQLVELPARVEDKEILGIARSSDLIIVLITSLNELVQIAAILKRENITAKRIFVLNKIDSISNEEKNKLKAVGSLIKISAKNRTGLDELKQKIFEQINLIRIYTKEPGKKPSERPMILKKNATVKDLAEKIRHGLHERFLKAKIWGKSAKFPSQTVGLEHRLEDRDVVEIYLK